MWADHSLSASIAELFADAQHLGRKRYHLDLSRSSRVVGPVKDGWSTDFDAWSRQARLELQRAAGERAEREREQFSDEERRNRWRNRWARASPAGRAALLGYSKRYRQRVDEEIRRRRAARPLAVQPAHTEVRQRCACGGYWEARQGMKRVMHVGGSGAGCRLG